MPPPGRPFAELEKDNPFRQAVTPAYERIVQHLGAPRDALGKAEKFMEVAFLVDKDVYLENLANAIRKEEGKNPADARKAAENRPGFKRGDFVYINDGASLGRIPEIITHESIHLLQSYVFNFNWKHFNEGIVQWLTERIVPDVPRSGYAEHVAAIEALEKVVSEAPIRNALYSGSADEIRAKFDARPNRGTYDFNWFIRCIEDEDLRGLIPERIKNGPEDVPVLPSKEEDG